MQIRIFISSLLMAMSFALLTNTTAAGPTIPAGAKTLSNEEIKAFLDGRTFGLVVYDSEKSMVGTSTWDLERGIVYGKYSWDNQSPKDWERKWYVENDKNCTKPKNGEPECMNIYIDGDKFMEVTNDGVIHAVSSPID